MRRKITNVSRESGKKWTKSIPRGDAKPLSIKNLCSLFRTLLLQVLNKLQSQADIFAMQKHTKKTAVD